MTQVVCSISTMIDRRRLSSKPEFISVTMIPDRVVVIAKLGNMGSAEVRARAIVSCLRIVAIEFSTCRAGRIGDASLGFGRKDRRDIWRCAGA